MAAAKRPSNRRRSTSSGSGYDQIVHDAAESMLREQRRQARWENNLALQDRGPDRVLNAKRTTINRSTGKATTSQLVRKGGSVYAQFRKGGKPAAPLSRVPRSSGPASMKAAGSTSGSAAKRSKVDVKAAGKTARSTRAVGTPRAGAAGGRGNTGGRIGMARGMGRGGSAGKRHGK